MSSHTIELPNETAVKLDFLNVAYELKSGACLSVRSLVECLFSIEF
ncbi:DUF3924 family protein, partial [Bacillus thuringiensis]